jgi:hypothetical protein
VERREPDMSTHFLRRLGDHPSAWRRWSRT